ncbi:unnamed protein product [Closterium sp. NIES-65]|nr:unnamed protein product [Closterium sp. NIES-65]
MRRPAPPVDPARHPSARLRRPPTPRTARRPPAPPVDPARRPSTPCAALAAPCAARRPCAPPVDPLRRPSTPRAARRPRTPPVDPARRSSTLCAALAAPCTARRPRVPPLRPRRPNLRSHRPHLRPCRPHLRSLPPSPAASPPLPAAQPPSRRLRHLLQRRPLPEPPGPPHLAEQHGRAAHQLSSRATEPPSTRAAEPPCSRAAQQQSSRAALQPSRPLAEPPCSRAAQQPSRPAADPRGSRAARAAEPPSSRAAEPTSRRAAKTPSHRAALPPSRPSSPVRVLAFDAEGQAIDFDVWVDDLQLFLQCDRADGLSLFDLTSGASPAPAADADATYKSAQTLYDAVVARYSSPATAALSRLMLPYLFPDLAAFPTVADLITHLRTSDTRYRTALPADFCAKNPPPMYITLYYIVTRLPYSLRVVSDHFLSVCPTTLTVDLLEKGVPPPPFCPLLPLLLRPTSLGLSQSVRRLPLAGDAALVRARGAGALEERAGAVEVEVEAAGGVGLAVGVEVGVEVSVAAVEVEAAAAVAVGAEVAEVVAVEEAAEAAVVAEAAEAVEAAGVAVELVAGLHRGVAPVVVSASSSSAVVRPCPLSSSVSGTLHASGVGVLVRAPTSYAPATVQEQCGGAHPTQRDFGRLTDAWRRQFPEATEIPRWGELSRAGVAIYDLDFDAILSAMYATAARGTGEAAALGACDAAALGASTSASSGPGESALSGTTSASASLTFTLDSGASRSFFRDRTTLTPLSQPVAVSLADPSGGPVLSHFSTILPCPAAPSGTLSSLYLPSFSTNLVSGADLQDGGVYLFTPARQRVTHCTEASTGRHLATFTRQPGSSQYTLTTPSPPVAESGRVAVSGQVFAAASRSGPESAPCSCRLVSHETLLLHHRLGHPSLLRLRGMVSRLLVSGLPRSLPPLPQGPGPTCVPCVEGRQRAAPHSSQFPPTEAPLQTLHMDVWGPARVRGQGHERYFLLVVDDYSRYTAVFPLRSKGDVTEVLIDRIRAARLQLRQSFGSDFPVLRLHSDRGGEFSSALLSAYFRARGLHQTLTLPDSPQQNGIAERRIGMVMDVARTSMVHAAAPHFLWPFAVRYAAHQINLHPRVSRPETSPALLWTGKVGDASAFRVWVYRAFVRDLFANKLSLRASPCVFLGIPPDAPGWKFYHPTSRRPPPVDHLSPQGPAPSGVSQADAVEPVEVTGDSGAAGGAEPGGADSGGADFGGAEPGGAATGGAEPGGAEPGGALGGAEPGGAEPGGAEPGGAEPGGALPGCAEPGGAELGGAPPGGSPGASSLREPLSPQELREWFARRWRRAAGAGGSTATEGAAVAGPGGARTASTGAAGPAGSTGAGAAQGVGTETTSGSPTGGTTGAAGGSGGAEGTAGASAPAGSTGAVPVVSGVAARPRPYFVPLLQQVLGLPPSTGPPPLECLQPVPSQLQLQPTSPLPAPSPYSGPTGGLAERREPASCPASPVRAASTSGRGSRPRPPPVPGTHRMSLRPSTAPLCAPLPSPPESSLPALSDPESDSLRAASPTITRLLATVVTDPSFESTAASALVTELVDFAPRCRLDYAASLVA